MRILTLLSAFTILAVGTTGCATQEKAESGDGQAVSAPAGESSVTDSDKAAKAANADNNLSAEERAEKRHRLLEMTSQTLLEISEKNPDVFKHLEEAYGYAVFDSTGYNLVLYVAETGSGIAFDNATKAPVYMNMIRAGTGPGIGYKEYRQLLLFTTEGAYEQFLGAGIDVGASADLGPLASGSVSFNPYVTTYTITDKGLDVQANWGGMIYVESAALNQAE